MKKIGAAIIVFCLVFSNMFVSHIKQAFAGTGAEIEVSSETGKTGETVEVSVTLKNMPNICAAQFLVEYDRSKLKLVSVSHTGFMSPNFSSSDMELYPYKLSWGDGLNTCNSGESGEAAVLTFEILEGFTEGSETISVSLDEAYDLDMNAVSFTSGNGTIEVEKEIHEHTFGEWETIKEANCTEEGQEVLRCLDCQEIVEERVINAKGHTYGEWEIKKEATILESGLKERTCSVCGNVEEKEIPQIVHEDKDHIFNGKEEIIKEATCTEEGSKRVYCSVELCQEYETVTIPAKGHVEGEWIVTKESTCTENGEMEKRCNVCNELLATKTLEKAEHVYGDEIIVKEPTFKEDGESVKICENCGNEVTIIVPKLMDSHIHDFSGKEEIISEASCTEKGVAHIHCSNEECEAVKVVEIAATGHQYGEWQITKEATTESTGEKERVCAICQYVEKEEIAKLPATTGNETQNTPSQATETQTSVNQTPTVQSSENQTTTVQTAEQNISTEQNDAATVKTGDNSNIGIWICMILFAGISMIEISSKVIKNKTK